MNTWIKKALSLVLIIALILPVIPCMASAEEAAMEATEDVIYYSDLFYGYSHLYLNSDSLYNYAMDTTKGMMSICDDYIDSPSFFWTAVSSSISSSTKPEEMLQWMSDAAVGTTFNYNDALDAANAKFAKKLLNKSSISVAEAFGMGGKVMGKFEAAMEVWEDFDVLLAGNAITPKEAIIKFLNKLGEIKALKKIPTAKITTLIDKFELNDTVEMMLGCVDDVTEVAQALITALAVEDLRLEMIADIRNHAPSGSTLYDGMSRLHNQLDSGFAGYFMESYATEKIFSEVVKNTAEVFDYTAAGMVYNLMTGVLNVASSVVLDFIFNVPSADDFFEQVILTNYAAEMYSAVRSKYGTFAELGSFTSQNVLEYEDMVRGLIAITNAGLDATKKITLSSNDIVLETLIDSYGDYSYETYVDSVKSAISAIEPQKRVTKVIVEDYYYEERFVFHAASENIRDGFFYLFQNSLNYASNITSITLSDSEFVFDKSLSSVTIPLSVECRGGKISGESEVIVEGDISGGDGGLSISKEIELKVRGDVVFDDADSLVNDGTLIVEGDISLIGYSTWLHGASRWSMLTNQGTTVVYGSLMMPKFGAIKNYGDLIIYNDLTTSDSAFGYNPNATFDGNIGGAIFYDSGRTTVVGNMETADTWWPLKAYHQTEDGILVVIGELLKRCDEDEWLANGIVRNASAASVEILIDNIGAVTLERELCIEKVREVYERLPDEEKKAVSNYEVLTEAERQLAELIAEEQAIANNAIVKIVAIGAVTENSYASVETARSAYEELTPYQKDLVTNYDSLVAAEIRLAELFDERIAAIGAVKADSIDAIEEGFSTYDMLPDESRAYVTKYEDLVSAKNCWIELFRCDHASISVNFKEAALEAAKQDWWSAAEATGVNTSAFGTVYGAAMGSKEAEGYAGMRAWLEENYGWTINEDKSQFKNQYYGKNLWLNAEQNAPWGVAFDNLQFREGRNETAFDIAAENEGTYLFELDMVKHTATDTGVSAYTGKLAGGPYVDISVNDELLYDNYYFGDSNGRYVESFGSVYLYEGVNTVSFKHVLSYHGVDLGGRCTTALCGIKLVQFNTSRERQIDDYVDNGNGTHNLVGLCSCGEPLDSYEICFDSDGDALCDRCGSFVCSHKTITATYTTGSDETHYAVEACESCGTIVAERDEDCTDNDHNTACDFCGGDVVCLHAEDIWVTTAEIVDEEMHTTTTTCACGELIETVTAACADLDQNEACDGCGRFMCAHNDLTVDVASLGDKTHSISVVCNTCGASDEEVQACEDVDADELCDYCKTSMSEIETISVAGSNMTLGNSLVLNFLVKKTDVTVEGLTAYVTHHTADSDVVYEYPQSDWTAQGIYYKIPVAVAASQMTDMVDIEIKGADGRVYNTAYSDSVCSYFARLYAKTTEETAKPLMVDMLNYGASAQTYFGYKTDTLANAELTEEQQALATPDAACVNEQEKDDNYYGTTLSLKDCIELNFIFKNLNGKDISTMYADVSFTNSLGEEKHVTLSSDAVSSQAYGYRCLVKVTEPVLADASQLVSVTLYNGDGTVYSTVKDSVQSYVSRYIAKNGDDTGLYGNIMKLSKSAFAYIESK